MNHVKRHLPFPVISVFSLSLSLCLSLALAVSSCNFSEQKGETDNGVVAPITEADLNYANLNDKVFGPYCIGCHSAAGGREEAGVSLDSHANVILHLAPVREAAVDKRTMPPSGSRQLSASDYALLKAWTEAGAPEGN